MMELGDMLGMSTYFRFCRMWKFNLKIVKIILGSSKWDQTTGPLEICVGDVFISMRGGRTRGEIARCFARCA